MYMYMYVCMNIAFRNLYMGIMFLFVFEYNHRGQDTTTTVLSSRCDPADPTEEESTSASVAIFV